MEAVNFDNKRTYCASESLVLEAKEKNSSFYLNFAYTDYGGTFLDKVVITYFKKNHPESIVYEKTSWHGENAFIYGDLAIDFAREYSCYLLGFEEIEDLYYSMRSAMIAESAKDFYKWKEDLFLVEKDIAIDSIMEYLEDCSIQPNMVDYCETRLIDYLRDCQILHFEATAA